MSLERLAEDQNRKDRSLLDLGSHRKSKFIAEGNGVLQICVKSVELGVVLVVVQNGSLYAEPKRIDHFRTHVQIRSSSGCSKRDQMTNAQRQVPIKG